MPMTIRPVSTVGSIGLSETNTIGYYVNQPVVNFLMRLDGCFIFSLTRLVIRKEARRFFRIVPPAIIELCG